MKNYVLGESLLTTTEEMYEKRYKALGYVEVKEAKQEKTEKEPKKETSKKED